MNRIATILGLFSIVINAAMGFSGAMLFCEHEAGDSHFVSRAEHASEGHEDACHSHSELLAGEHWDDAVCDSCTDTEVVKDDSQEVLRSSAQDRLLAPPVVAIEFVGFGLAGGVKPIAVGLLPSSRAPPEVTPLSVAVVEQTVLII